jgi:hypothetical protein
MRTLRTYLSWLYAIASLACVQIAVSSIRGIVHRHHAFLRFRTLLVPVLFSVLAAIYAGAWWTTWKEKHSARGWGIAASLTQILLPLSIIYFWPSLWSHQLVLLGTGIVGLVAFSRRYEQSDFTARTYENVRIPGDGTGDALNKVAEFLIYAASLGTFFWWMAWLRAKGVSGNHGFWYRGLSVMLVVLTITTLHELGHMATGLAVGMKLRAFVAGPFQWQIREGKWEFRFKLQEILSADGATGVVPATSNFPRWRYVCMLAAGPLVNLFTGIVALRIAFTAEPNSSVQAEGLLALFGAWSLALCACNLLPFRTGDTYSDGARIYQSFSDGPWADFHRAITVVGSSLVTPLRPRNYDISAILRAGHCITQGQQALLLRLFAYTYFLDDGKIAEAGDALREAESIYHRCASSIPAGLHTAFVFGNAYARRDAVAARQWWTRMEAKKPTRFNVDYWMANSALKWIEGNLKEANEAWEKGSILAQQLPRAGAYEFDRYCCSLLRKALDEVSVAG